MLSMQRIPPYEQQVKIAICISSYGDDKWARLAHERALPSALKQEADSVIIEHQPGGNIASCRNDAAKRAIADYICFLDADDELDDNYIYRMRRAIAKNEGMSKMYAPRVIYVNNGRRSAPKYWKEVPLSEGNWLVIGTLVPKEEFLQVGGFEAWPHAYEDWQLFAKLWKGGMTIEKVPGAIYIAHVMPNSRNKDMDHNKRVRTHYGIGYKLFPEIYTEEWLDQHLRREPLGGRARRR